MNIVVDEKGKLWEWNVLNQEWRCLNYSKFGYYKNLEDLEQIHGVLYKIQRGDIVRTTPELHETVQVVLPDNVKTYSGEVEEIHDDEIVLRVQVPKSRIKMLEQP